MIEKGMRRRRMDGRGRVPLFSSHALSSSKRIYIERYQGYQRDMCLGILSNLSNL